MMYTRLHLEVGGGWHELGGRGKGVVHTGVSQVVCQVLDGAFASDDGLRRQSSKSEVSAHSRAALLSPPLHTIPSYIMNPTDLMAAFGREITLF